MADARDAVKPAADPAQVKDLMHAEDMYNDPRWSLSDKDVARIKEREREVSTQEHAKHQKDKNGNLMVPDDWQAPDGFSGHVIHKGVQLSYPGWMINRETDKLSDFGIDKNETDVPKGKN